MAVKKPKKPKPTTAPTKQRGVQIGTHIIKPRKKK
jgi:hypothetical protein